MNNLPLLGFDTETHKIALGNLCPRLVCLQMATRVNEHELFSDLQGRAEEAALIENINTLMSGKYIIAAHNNAYDFAVLGANYPHLMPRLFQLLEEGKVHCTSIRERLLNLTLSGDLEYYQTPGGAIKIEYSMAFLSKFYLGKDRKEQKESPDSWRVNYDVLDGVPLERWPQDAKDYALEDATDVVLVWECQERRRREIWERTGHDPFQTLDFQTAVDFGLYLMSAWGIHVDPAKVMALYAKMQAELSSDKISLLLQSGILRPGRPAQPNKLGHKNHVAGCRKKWVENGRTVECNCPVKMTAAVDESLDKAKLAEYVRALAARDNRVTVKMTAASDKFPEGQVSVDADWLEEHAKYDPLLQQMQHRNSLLKIVDTELPRMMMKDEKGNPIMGLPSPLVHPRYDVLKETGRTSSRADKLYPSINAQNVDPRARECYVAPPGYLMFSIDYSQMELGTLGQTCLRLFGQSVIADKINAGEDLHAFLGAQIALAMHEPFRNWIAGHNYAASRDDVYRMFVMLAEDAYQPNRDVYKKYRKLAKPTGLGYPGGLGPDTFIDFARGAPYHEIIDVETATQLRDIWKATFPEMELYFDYINTQLGDPINREREVIDKKTKLPKIVKLYAYTSPFGMYRAGAVYCAAANGLGLQTPSSEGAKLALFNVIRACYDPSLRSILSDDDRGVACRPTAFIHDEILGIVRDDELAADRVAMIQRIMIEAMQIITPDVKARSAACLMRHWSKDAEPVFDANKKLIVWEPKPKAA